MTAKDLIEKLSQVSPDTEIVSGMWNGRVDTYTVIDRVHVFPYDAIYADFFGTPGAFDDGLMKIRSKDVVYISSLFEETDKRIVADRRIIWRIDNIMRMHRSRTWRLERIWQVLKEFERNDYL
jgi:hypothetical protein